LRSGSTIANEVIRGVVIASWIGPWIGKAGNRHHPRLL